MFHSITTNSSKAPLLRGFATTFSLKSCFPFSYWFPLCGNESFLWSGVSAIASTVLYVNSRSPCAHTFLYLVRTDRNCSIFCWFNGSNFHPGNLGAKKRGFFGVCISFFLKTKEGETRRLSPACRLRKFLQNDHWA